MTYQFKIESGIPVPAQAGRRGAIKTAKRNALESLAAAAIGDSVLIPNAQLAGSNRPCDLVTATAYGVGGSGWACVRRVEGGYRVWKIAEPKAVS